MKFMIKKNLLKCLVGVIALTTAITGCSDSNTSSNTSSASNSSSIVSKPDPNMQLNIATTESVINNGLMEKPWLQVSFVSGRLYRGLFLATAGTTDVQPDLVDTYSVSKDGLTYEFTLKDDLYWSDGEPITLDDVVFSIEAVLELSTEQIISTLFMTGFSGIEGAEEFCANPSVGLSGLSISDDTLTITLSNPNNLFLQMLSQFIILPRHGFEGVPPTSFHDADLEYWKDPICSGLYKLDEHVPGEYLKLVYNEYYTKQVPYINSILLRSDFEYDELDYSETNDISQILDYRAISNQIEYDADSIFYRYFVFNINKGGELDPVLSDIRVRKALTYAIDREALISKVYYGIGSINNTGAVQVYDSPIDVDYPYDPDLALELLLEAEYDFDRPITLLYYYSDDVSIKFMEETANYLRAIGLTVDVIKGNLFNDESDHYDMGLKGLPVYSISDWYNEYLSSSQMYTTVYGYDDTRFDDLIIDFNQATSIAQRNDALIKLQELEYELLYKYPVFIMGHRVYLKNTVEIPNDVIFGDSKYKYFLDIAEWKISS